MLATYSRIVNGHDPWRVKLAAIICALASCTAVTLLENAAKLTRQMRQIWRFGSAARIVAGKPKWRLTHCADDRNAQARISETEI
jgi:NO-binding membrane sensor protein with MHYT domain